MRTVRNTVDTGRTIICTIHEPSIDIFEALDELLLMQLGGRVIYGGKLGLHSQIMIDYFQGINGISPIPNGYNPTTWMLEGSGSYNYANECSNCWFKTIKSHEINFQYHNYLFIELCIFASWFKKKLNSRFIDSNRSSLFSMLDSWGSFADSICSTANNCVWCHHLFYDPFSNDNKEIFYLVFLFLTFTYYTFSGMMAVGLIPNQDLASVNMLEWLTWCYYISPVTWTLRGIISSQLGDKESMIEEPQFNGIVKEYLKANLGYGPGMIGVSVVVLIGFYGFCQWLMLVIGRFIPMVHNYFFITTAVTTSWLGGILSTLLNLFRNLLPHYKAINERHIFRLSLIASSSPFNFVSPSLACGGGGLS
ncbi:ABC transporter G family member 31-like [Tripterygium wilfordii]|uniref:ABC transporter G family member 31-like n=1 Tax=Tripterygium wilfordii TaxID=458696 RepID=UPI0018F83B0E|nr:ABC transporter G family member 31-like [Tripterygium wilfordii]